MTLTSPATTQRVGPVEAGEKRLQEQLPKGQEGTKWGDPGQTAPHSTQSSPTRNTTAHGSRQAALPAAGSSGGLEGGAAGREERVTQHTPPPLTSVHPGHPPARSRQDLSLVRVVCPHHGGSGGSPRHLTGAPGIYNSRFHKDWQRLPHTGTGTHPSTASPRLPPERICPRRGAGACRHPQAPPARGGQTGMPPYWPRTLYSPPSFSGPSQEEQAGPTNQIYFFFPL